MANLDICRRLLRSRLQRVGWLLLVALLPAVAQALKDNGIHVGAPKIYDSRALTLMLDSLAQSLRSTSFIDTKTLAAALGNLQGFNNQDTSVAGFANGAVGSQAASVFAGTTGASSQNLSGSTNPPGVSITVAPVLNSGSAPVTTGPATPAATLGPQPPALPSLQTAPSFTPTFGENAGDLLSDEVNLTYQFDNVSMLLQRSLSDRLYHDKARLQAVMGFDIDIEPGEEARDAAAVVEVSVSLSDCHHVPHCDRSQPLSLVALMPEEGSHNSATLSQKAYAFGGAIASTVFSVGGAYQKRSQIFYLYRDMDTVSFQRPDPTSSTVDFGWQFRPVLGRRTVSPGLRHMMAVLALPSNDLPDSDAQSPDEEGKTPTLSATVKTSWTRYDGSTQAVGVTRSFWASLFGTGKLPADSQPQVFNDIPVPTTETTQSDLGPSITTVKWVQGNASSGVAIVTGTNFFPGTAVRFGTKTYSTPADGLVIKSDQQLEVALPITAAVTEGVLSGRYGKAVPLEASDAALPAGFTLQNIAPSAEGNDMYQVDLILAFYDRAHEQQHVSISDLQDKANSPVVSVNGTPLATPSFLSSGRGSTAIVTTFVPSSFLKSASATFTVTFPFGGPPWSASLPFYQATLKVVRLGGRTNTELFISASDPTMLLCGNHPSQPAQNNPTQTWVLQLDGQTAFPVLPPGAPIPSHGGLKCLRHHPETLSFDMQTADLKPYRHFALVNTEGIFPIIVGDVPPPQPPPPGPSLAKDQKVMVPQNVAKTVTFKGKDLDQVTKVTFDKENLEFSCNDDGTEISIRLTRTVTSKAGDGDELDLLSDGNDPVHAAFSVTPAPAPKGGK